MKGPATAEPTLSGENLLLGVFHTPTATDDQEVTILVAVEDPEVLAMHLANVVDAFLDAHDIIDEEARMGITSRILTSAATHLGLGEEDDDPADTEDELS